MAKKDLEAARAFIRQQDVRDVRKKVRGVANRCPQLTRVERTTLAESRAVMVTRLTDWNARLWLTFCSMNNLRGRS